MRDGANDRVPGMGHVRVSVMAAMSISSHTEEATQIQLRPVLHFSIRKKSDHKNFVGKIKKDC